MMRLLLHTHQTGDSAHDQRQTITGIVINDLAGATAYYRDTLGLAWHEGRVSLVF
jgi:hypothetical protein